MNTRTRNVTIVAAAALLVVLVVALLFAASGDDKSESTSQPETPATEAVTPNAAAAAPTTEAVVAETPAQPSAGDPYDCAAENDAIVAASAAGTSTITPGLSVQSCKRSVVDPTYAVLDFGGTTGKDLLLMHFADGSWTVSEAPPAPDDPYREYYFFGCKAPAPVIGDRPLELC